MPDDEDKKGTLTSMKSMFENCYNIKNVTINALNSVGLSDVSCLFKNCTSLETANIYLAHANSLTTTESMFDGCKNLKSIKGLYSFSAPNLKTREKMFSNCSVITEIDLSQLNTKNVTNMGSTFFGCSKLEKLLISPLLFDITKVAKDSWTFSAAYKVNIYLRKFTNGSRALSRQEAEQYTTIVKTKFVEKFTQSPQGVFIYNIDWLNR